MSQHHIMIRFVRTASMLFVLIGLFMVFVYTPFYSKFLLASLNYFVNVEVNPVAAQSQRAAALTDDESEEPGSELWVARQAYLTAMEQAIALGESYRLPELRQRYNQLKQRIENQESIKIPMQVILETPDLHDVEALKYNAEKQLGPFSLHDEYLAFIKMPVDYSDDVLNDDQFLFDLAYLRAKDKTTGQNNRINTAHAIVVLGGGLDLADNKKDIIVNDYTRLRLETTIQVAKKYPLPIVLSGVEAPYMQAWLKQHHVEAKLLEDRSMNTCENSRFSSLLLQKKGGAPTVILITDAYHMPRTRRLFAMNGIETIPFVAPMPVQLTRWRPSERNYDHSRRAQYETLATIRDVLFGSSSCREVP